MDDKEKKDPKPPSENQEAPAEDDNKMKPQTLSESIVDDNGSKPPVGGGKLDASMEKVEKEDPSVNKAKPQTLSASTVNKPTGSAVEEIIQEQPIDPEDNAMQADDDEKSNEAEAPAQEDKEIPVEKKSEEAQS